MLKQNAERQYSWAMYYVRGEGDQATNWLQIEKLCKKQKPHKFTSKDSYIEKYSLSHLVTSLCSTVSHLFVRSVQFVMCASLRSIPLTRFLLCNLSRRCDCHPVRLITSFLSDPCVSDSQPSKKATAPTRTWTTAHFAHHVDVPTCAVYVVT